MVEPRSPVSTVAFVDEYCQTYQNLFSDVRNIEAFKFLHLGMISEIKRKSLPEIARVVGIKDGQSLHNFWRDTPWNVKAFREMRLWLIKVSIGEQPIKLCIDETGDEKREQRLTMSLNNTSAIWGKLPMASSQSMPMQSSLTSQFL